MRILGFNRVELLLAPGDIHEAAERFNELLGTSFAPPRLTAGGQVLTTTDWENHVELYGPSGPDSMIASRIAEKGRGAIGPLVWEVASIEEAREYVVGRGHRIHPDWVGVAGTNQWRPPITGISRGAFGTDLSGDQTIS
jgi:hypothetical protein